MQITPKVRKIFYERIRIDEDGCWIWQGEVIDGEPIVWIDGIAENAKKIAFLLMDMPVPVEPIMTHSKLDVNPEHHSVKKVKNNKYSEQIYADMGKTHVAGDLTDSGDGISQSTT
jgi:hypothetical protein